MKKAKRISLIVASALVLSGLLISFLGFAAVGFDFTRLNRTKPITKSITVEDSFDSISLDVSLCDVRFLPSRNNYCEIVYTLPENTSCSVSVQNDCLTVCDEDSRSWYEYIGIFWGDMHMDIYLPQTDYNSLEISGSVGDIEIPEDFSFEEAELKTETGGIDFSASVEKRLSLQSDTGHVNASCAAPESLEITTDTGDISVSSMEIGSLLTLKSDTGTISLMDINTCDISAESSSGDIELSAVIASGTLDIENDTGNVELRSCDANTIYIKTDTGNVSGTLLSEKVFITESDTGRVDVPKTITGGRCEVTTDTGNIEFNLSRDF